MKEYTFEEFCALPMRLVMHISAEKEHYLHRHNDEAGVSKIVITRIKKDGGFGKSYPSYHLTGDERVFLTADQVYLAYMEKACGVVSAEGIQ